MDRTSAAALALVCLLALSSYAPIIFPILSIATLGCMVSGLLLFPRLRLSIPLTLEPLAPVEPFDSEEQAKTYERSITLNGQPLPMSPFPKRITLSMTLKNLSMLAAMGVGSVIYLALYFRAGMASLQLTEPGSKTYLAEYAVGYFTILLFSLSWVWLKERRVLRRAGITIGVRCDATVVGSRFRSIQYRFRDALGGYRGGYDLDLEKHPQDRLVLIFYDSGHPDRSKPSCGFVFHKFDIEHS